MRLCKVLGLKKVDLNVLLVVMSVSVLFHEEHEEHEEEVRSMYVRRRYTKRNKKNEASISTWKWQWKHLPGNRVYAHACPRPCPFMNMLNLPRCLIC